MKIKVNHILLFLIFAFSLAFRLYLVLNAQNFADQDAYFQLRHINSVVDDKKIIYYDQLSYGGRYILHPPLFYIVMAFLTFGNKLMLKIIPEIFFSLIVFLVYFMAKDVSGNEKAALFSAMLAAFIPIFIQKTVNTLSTYSLALPLLLLMLYSLLKLDEKIYRNIFIACSFLLPLIHPIAILFILCILIYFILLSGGAVSPTKIKKEAILFSTLIIVLMEFIIYKKALFSYGLNAIWENIPANILDDLYRQFSVNDLVIGLGILPLVLGSIGVYLGIKEKKKSIYLYSSFLLTILLLLSTRLITLSVGLMVLGIFLSIFVAITINYIVFYINRTKLHKINYFIAFILIFLFVILSFIPSLGNGKVSSLDNDVIGDMLWLKENTNKDDVVVGNLMEGNIITSIAERKNVVDANFLLAQNSVKRLKDINGLYTTFTEAKALEIIRRYNIKVIYLSDETQKIYGIKDLNFVKGSNCFDWRLKFYVFKC